MMYLLDTHAFIWSVLDTGKLSKKTSQIICDNSNDICVSTVSFWEISLKIRIKKFEFTGLDCKELKKYADTQRFSVITLSAEEAQTYCELELIKEHTDPFDRMLIWQTIKRNIHLISKDSNFPQYKEYGLKLTW